MKAASVPPVRSSQHEKRIDGSLLGCASIVNPDLRVHDCEVTGCLG